MSSNMECDVLGDAAFLQPRLELGVDYEACQILEDEAGAGCSAEFQGLLADGDCGFGFGLFSAETNAFSSIGEVAYVFPSELQNIGDSQAGKTGEQGSSAEDRRVAGRVL